MKKTFLLSLASCLTVLSLYAQNLGFKYSNTLRFVNENNDTLPNPFVGGFIAPQFNNVDIDLDGKKDLLVFDRSGNRLLPYINQGNVGEIKYRFAPEYIKSFPRIVNWILMVDYDRDGKEDIFTQSTFTNGSSKNTVRVYRNSSAAQLKFDLVTDALEEGYPRKADPITPYDTFPYELNANLNDLPAITDIDGDGDIDYFSTQSTGGEIIFWKNYQVEKNLPNNQFFFRSCENCWGSVIIGFMVGLGHSCYKFHLKTSAHGGLTLSAFDLDGDGDKEMLAGDVAKNSLYKLHNSRVELNWKYKGFSSDTITSFDTVFPPANPSLFPVFQAPYFVDVNNDGKKDLVIAPFAISSSKTKNQVWYYENTGTASVPVFTLRQKNFLQEHFVDLGSRLAPALFDFDNDGDKDLLAGTLGDYEYSLNSRDRLVLFENIKNSSYPVFKMRDTNYLDLHSRGLTYIKPASGDLNKDGKPDLLIGSSNGKLIYFENNTSGAGPATFKAPDTSFASIDVGEMSAPFIFDLNFDKKPDLVVGENDGTLNYFRNYGNKKDSFYFKAIPEADSLGKILPSSPSGLSNPCLFDYKNDSMVEMLVGFFDGNIKSYRVGVELEKAFQEIDTCLMLPGNSNYSSGSFGANSRSIPLVADMDNDAIPDLLVGLQYGGLQFFKGYDRGNMPNILGRDTVIPRDTGTFISSRPVNAQQLHIYPNPADKQLYINRDKSEGPVYIHLYDISGRLLLSTQMKAGESNFSIDLTVFPEGILLLNLYSDTQYLDTQRIVHLGR